MKKLLYALFLIVGIGSCTQTTLHYNHIIDNAGSVMFDNPDSAVSMLELIESSELPVDSIRAKYYYVMACAHEQQGELMLSDSMIRYSAEYYEDKDLNRYIRSATLLALYKYRIGESKTAIALLDSLSNLTNVPDSLLLLLLRQRAYFGKEILDLDENRSRHIIRRLIYIDKDSTWQQQYKYWLYIDFLFKEHYDSALVVLNDLITQAKLRKSSQEQFRYEYEKIGVLEEMGRLSESWDLTNKFIEKAPGNSIQHYIFLWRSLTLFNMGHVSQAEEELSKADSCASAISEAQKDYYNSFAYVLRTVFDYHKSGKLSLIKMAQINNSQKDNLIRIQSLQWETEQSALESENKRLILKAKNERQMAIIVLIIFASLLVSGILFWYARDRKRKTIDAQERAETLQKMVDELKASTQPENNREALRRAMLQQLGIIKMVAKTPTEQNRDMLRKISSVNSDTNGSLVNWENVYEIIDNVYSDFYTHLHEHYGEILSDKEEQIIVLMMAGFSTKEISVITTQSSATIYVRKSSIRKKLGIPEKEDILGFLHGSLLL